jgi:hypothetical protein
MAQRDITIQFLDKRFKILIKQDSQPDRVIWVNGSEARFLFKELDFLINTRPRSEDDRLSLEKEREMAEADAAEKVEDEAQSPGSPDVEGTP